MKINAAEVEQSDYAYLVSWDDYSAPALLYHIQKGGALAWATFKPFTMSMGNESRSYGYGSLVLPVKNQKISKDSLYHMVLSRIKISISFSNLPPY